MQQYVTRFLNQRACVILFQLLWRHTAGSMREYMCSSVVESQHLRDPLQFLFHAAFYCVLIIIASFCKNIHLFQQKIFGTILQFFSNLIYSSCNLPSGLSQSLLNVGRSLLGLTLLAGEFNPSVVDPFTMHVLSYIKAIM